MMCLASCVYLFDVYKKTTIIVYNKNMYYSDIMVARGVGGVDSLMCLVSCVLNICIICV